jgi:hypothetical protein
MAFQIKLPFLIFKASGITLQGVTNRNLWIEIEPELSKRGQVKIRGKDGKERLLSALGDLKQKALARRAQMTAERVKAPIGWLSGLLLGGYVVSEGIDRLLRPNCFGTFYYQDPACKPCSYRERCKVEKLKRQHQ